MREIITRKCAKCKGVIEINVDDIDSVIYFNKLYYHKDCFVTMAQQKAASKRGKPQMWQDALRNIWSLEAETKRMLESYAAKDELNEWLLRNYDVSMVPSYFWQLVVDLESGKYKNKRCKPLDIKTLCECWKWGQQKLDKVALGNKMNHRGPENDVDRLRYDLAILITKYPLFLKHKAKIAAVEATNNFEQKQPNLDYSTLNKSQVDNDNDILDLMDEIF
jgi:hypothetical protein